MMDVKVQPLGPIKANCYVLSRPERSDCVVVDPGGEADKILQMMNGKQLAGVLLTHGHYDHIGAVDALCKNGAPVYIGENDCECLADPEKNVSSTFAVPVHVQTVPVPLADGQQLTLAGIFFTVIATPGHTKGGVCYQAENLLFTGDTLFCHGFGRMDLYGGSRREMRRSLSLLLKTMQGDFTVYPGHGEETTLQAEREHYL